MIRLVLFFFVSSMFTISAVATDDPNEAAIDARTGDMALRKYYGGPLWFCQNNLENPLPADKVV